MPVRIVQSKQNARLKELRLALAQAGRSGRDASGGLVGIEGPNLIAEAVRAKLSIECVFVAQEAERLLDGLALAPETEVLLAPAAVLASALTTETPQPAAALVRPRAWSWRDITGDARKAIPLVLVLAGIQDPGNLGTIVRSAEAFGATGVVALPGTVSAWNPKAVRASAGSVFRVPLRAAGAEECFKRLRAADVAIWTTAMRDAIEVEPKVNPKNPDSLLFVDGQPNEQIFRMNAEGVGVERVTNGEGEASNPAWNPDGQHIAYAWTRGYQAGDFNIFVIDIGAPQEYVQLTHSEGKNENPVWAPDGAHIVFASTRAGKRSQIFSMNADGKQVKQLTMQGINKYPVWGVK